MWCYVSSPHKLFSMRKFLTFSVIVFYFKMYVTSLVFEIYIQCVMGKVSPFWIIHFANALSLFQVLSTAQQTRASWAISVRKHYHDAIHFSRNLETACLASMLEAPIQRFQCVWKSFWGQFRGFEKSWISSSDYEGMTAWKPLSHHSNKERTPKLVDNNPSKSIRSIARDRRMSEFHIRQVKQPA